MDSQQKENDTDPKEEQDLENVLKFSVLDLEKIDVNIYRGTNLWRPGNSRYVFGGQIVGQALVAASKTVPDDRHVHSLHAYFLIGGNPSLPVIYYVDRTRDGDTYTSRNVKAIQDGSAILTMQVSSKSVEPDSLHHQYTMPDVPPPEGLWNTEQIARNILNTEEVTPRLKASLKRFLADEVPVEVRPTDPDLYLRRKKHPPQRHIWMRALGHIGDNNKMHRCVAAYLSDMTLLGTALMPEPTFVPSFMTSLDHSMWFHTQFHTDEWMLYEVESPQAGAGKGLTLGRIWKRDGTLAVSVAQEGVIRGAMPKASL